MSDLTPEEAALELRCSPGTVMREPTEMEDRVAEAIRDAFFAQPVDRQNTFPRDPYWSTAARAAIRAMREPTAEMIDAGGRNIAYEIFGFGGAKTLMHYSSSGIEARDKEYADTAWPAMIDAASPPT